ncbi:Uncharacterised protein [Vibrio cholerae]|nr:Uncharacterised protein [Vibrio cholerae]CSC59283.1 Uncharacterised protein [Vibrio cholerae]CSI69754.1 Uncharacterised protein [Vibrio cholerae]
MHCASLKDLFLVARGTDSAENGAPQYGSTLILDWRPHSPAPPHTKYAPCADDWASVAYGAQTKLGSVVDAFPHCPQPERRSTIRPQQ